MTDRTARPTLLIVDDVVDNIALLSSLLKDAYRTKIATSGEKALKIAMADDPVDLILLDIMMPGMDGYEVCERLKADERTRNIPIIFLTAMTQPEDEERGLQLGAVDYITKPISPPILLARVQTHLALKQAQDYLRDQNAILEQKVIERTREIASVQDVTILAMASLAETRDNETGNHIRRTQNYVRVLAKQLQAHPRFQDMLTDQHVELLYKSAPLHDIGKVGVPDRVLLKPDRLTDDEFELMKQHTVYGRDAITAAEEKLDDAPTDSFLRFAREIAYSHQEKWDGTGYPEGLSGDDIPFSARLMALADVYDALISRRVYKPAFSHEEAARIISDGRGSHFDPDVVDAFIETEQEFREIAQRFADADPEAKG